MKRDYPSIADEMRHAIVRRILIDAFVVGVALLMLAIVWEMVR